MQHFGRQLLGGLKRLRGGRSAAVLLSFVIVATLTGCGRIGYETHQPSYLNDGGNADAVPDAPPASHCSDGLENEDETGIDCGGSACGACPDTSSCSAPSDCISGVCSAGTCQSATCSDGVQNQDETGVDCGGSTCGSCSPFATPSLINELSTASFESDPALRYDGLEMFFSSTRDGTVRIYVTSRASRSDPWGAPSVVSRLGTAGYEKGPELSGDGLTIFYTSQRNGSHDLFMSTRPNLGGQWSNPVEVTGLNTAGNEIKPTVFNNGLGLIWMTNGRSGAGGAGTQDLWQSRRSCTACGWSVPVELAGLNQASLDSGSPWVSDNGLEIYVGALFGASDKELGQSTRTGLSSPFGAPTRLDELASAGDDTNPTLTSDQSYIVFVRDEDLWHASR